MTDDSNSVVDEVGWRVVEDWSVDNFLRFEVTSYSEPEP